MSEPIVVPKGLYGVAVTDTGIAKSSADGSLTYRGYDIRTLFERSSFEETTFLVLEGRLPKRKELDDFTAALRSRTRVPSNVYQMVKNLPKDSHPMDVLRTAVSGLGATEHSLAPKEQQLSIIAKMPTLVANCYRIVNGKDVIEPEEKHNQAANFLYTLNGKVPSDFEAWAFERELILYMEHDVNASAFTVRVVASTLADIYAASTAGIAALKGPLHGGANEKAMEMLLAIGSADRARDYIQGALGRGEKVMGFGHRVYKKVDPRAQLSKELLKRLLEEKKKDLKLYTLCDAVERLIWDAKKLPANLDFYAAPIFFTLSIPIEVDTPIFAASRIVGWVSHYNEQVSDNKIFRPDAIYVGPKNLEYVPLDKR